MDHREKDRKRERSLAALHARAQSELEQALDLVRWETLMEPHRESIVARGRVVYESD